MSPAPKKLEKRIPTYAASGVRLRGYSPDAIKRLLGLSLIVAVRNRQGRIVSAQFRESGGGNPLRSTNLLGTRYSYVEQIHESRVWSHRRLTPRQDVEQKAGEPVEDEADRECFVRLIFRSVPLSCLVETL